MTGVTTLMMTSQLPNYQVTGQHMETPLDILHDQDLL